VRVWHVLEPIGGAHNPEVTSYLTISMAEKYFFSHGYRVKVCKLLSRDKDDPQSPAEHRYHYSAQLHLSVLDSHSLGLP
jgi:hypothetical protein